MPLAQAGAGVVVPARRPDAAAEAVAGIGGVEVDELDLADLASVASVRRTVPRLRSAARPRHRQRRDHGLPRDAGRPRLGGAIRHQPPRSLRPRQPAVAGDREGRWARRRRSRRSVIAVRPSVGTTCSSSTATTSGSPTARPRRPTCCSPCSSTRSGSGKACAPSPCIPGGIFTPLQRHLSTEEMVALGWIDEAGHAVGRGFKTPEQGASTTVWAATSSQLEGMGGVYCENCDIAEPSDDTTVPRGVWSWATDPEQAQRLWALSAELTGVDAIRGGARLSGPITFVSPDRHRPSETVTQNRQSPRSGCGEPRSIVRLVSASVGVGDKAPAFTLAGTGGQGVLAGRLRRPARRAGLLPR